MADQQGLHNEMGVYQDLPFVARAFSRSAADTSFCKWQRVVNRQDVSPHYILLKEKLPMFLSSFMNQVSIASL